MATTVHPLQIRCLRYLPTLTHGQCCDLKIDNGAKRWWLCRLPAKHTDHRVTIEKYDRATGTWQTARVFVDKEKQ